MSAVPVKGGVQLIAAPSKAGIKNDLFLHVKLTMDGVFWQSAT